MHSHQVTSRLRSGDGRPVACRCSRSRSIHRTARCIAAERATVALEKAPDKAAVSSRVEAVLEQWRDPAIRKQHLDLFTLKRDIKPFVQLDHVKRRRERELSEIASAAKKVGLTRQQVDENVGRLESLLPDLAPNLDKMRASDWVTLIKDVDRVAVMLITLKAYYPSANLSRIISKRPKLLLQDPKAMQEDAKQVRALLGERLGQETLDAIIEAVPDLMRPAQAALSLNNLKRWFPAQDPFEVLQKNPSLLYNVEEADLKPDPTYGGEVGLMD